MAANQTKAVALVTGASSGIGKSIALALIKEEYIVYGGARRIEPMADIKKADGHVIGLDITDENSTSSAVDLILSEQGRIDVLVNAAGYGQYGALEDIPLEEAHRQLEVNLFGGARLIQKILPSMRKQRSGKIVNVTSVGGKIHTPMGGWYHASKFAMEAYSDVLRLEVKPFGIDVIVIEPGVIDTEWGGIAIGEAERLSGSGAYRSLVEKYIQVQSSIKGSSPQVIADTAVKALSTTHPKARYHAGKMAGTVLFFRWLLPDRIFDKLAMASFR